MAALRGVHGPWNKIGDPQPTDPHSASSRATGHGGEVMAPRSANVTCTQCGKPFPLEPDQCDCGCQGFSVGPLPSSPTTATPVAWRYPNHAGQWQYFESAKRPTFSELIEPLYAAPPATPAPGDVGEIVRAHLGWIKSYAEMMTETNWRDMKLRLERQAEAMAPAIAQLSADSVDAARYRRLQILGCAPAYSKQLEQGSVLRFTGLDEFVDADLKAQPSRGEAAHPVVEGSLTPEPQKPKADMRQIFSDGDNTHRRPR